MNFDLTVGEASTIAQMTNIAHFKELLKPILVPRIVNTPQHRQVGDVSFLSGHSFNVKNSLSTCSQQCNKPDSTSNGTTSTTQLQWALFRFVI